MGEVLYLRKLVLGEASRCKGFPFIFPDASNRVCRPQNLLYGISDLVEQPDRPDDSFFLVGCGGRLAEERS